MWLYYHFLVSFSPFQLSYARQSVLASAWYIARCCPPTHPDVCLCGGEGVEGQCAVRQWVEFYVSRIRTATVWDAIPRDQLQAVLQVLSRPDITVEPHLSVPQLSGCPNYLTIELMIFIGVLLCIK